MQPFDFFLGGADLEMSAIRKLLVEVKDVGIFDQGLSWGAQASEYRAAIEDSLRQGRIPVLVELTDDMELDSTKIVVIDHHGSLAGKDRPTSLEQVFQLLERPQTEWSRELALVAANDRGHIAGMLELGATRDELVRIRAADRAAQGITLVDEDRALVALAHVEFLLQGRLLWVELPHSRTATVTDPMHVALGGPGYENLIVACPNETNFFGCGAAIERLRERYPQSWWGGELPLRGYWGYCERAPREDILDLLKPVLHSTEASVS